MRLLNYYGNGRKDTLLSIVAAFRVLRRKKLDLQVGPLDEKLLSSLGLFVSGDDAEMDVFEKAMEKESKRMRIEVAPAEFVGELK